MNKEILKRNIISAIRTPYIDPYGNCVVPNPKEGDTIIVQKKPGNSVNYVIFSEKKIVENITDGMPDRYKDHLVTLRYENGSQRPYDLQPVLDTDAQKEWDDEQNSIDREILAYYEEKGSGDYTGD